MPAEASEMSRSSGRNQFLQESFYDQKLKFRAWSRFRSGRSYSYILCNSSLYLVSVYDIENT